MKLLRPYKSEKIKKCCILVRLRCYDKPTKDFLTLVDARSGLNNSNLKKILTLHMRCSLSFKFSSSSDLASAPFEFVSIFMGIGDGGAGLSSSIFSGGGGGGGGDSLFLLFLCFFESLERKMLHLRTSNHEQQMSLVQRRTWVAW